MNNSIKVKSCSLAWGLILLLTISACQQQPSTKKLAVTSLDKNIKELRPGILEGYLTKEQIPNSLALVPPPPAKGTLAYALDSAIAAGWIATNDEARKTQATNDAVLAFPQATEAFNIVLDVNISEENTPHLYMIMRRTLADAGLSTYSAKNHYQRQRPFMVNNAPTCTPHEEEALRKDGSYPSGHAAIGWAWALILAEVFPEQADIIMERGKQFGISRNVCNVHWYSDVQVGRMMGAYTVAVLHANENFRADLKAAKEEVALLNTNYQ